MSREERRKGEAGAESGSRLDLALGKEVDGSVSERSEDESVLLPSSGEQGRRRTGKVLQVRRTGLPFLPRPSLEGLPGAPLGILSLYFLGTTIWQFSHVSPSESMELLGRRGWAKLAEEEDEGGKVGKYELLVGERGLVGGVAKGEVRGRGRFAWRLRLREAGGWLA